MKNKSEVLKAVKWYFGFTTKDAKKYIDCATDNTLTEIVKAYNRLRDF